jgi:hypothetical protein
MKIRLKYVYRIFEIKRIKILFNTIEMKINFFFFFFKLKLFKSNFFNKWEIAKVKDVVITIMVRRWKIK